MQGLTQQEVLQRRQRGEGNNTTVGTSRTIIDIVRANLFTFFNNLLFIIGVLLIALGQTSDALTSGGTFAIAGAVAHMVQQLKNHTGVEPACFMTGGAGWKMVPSMSVEVELVETLVMDGLLEIAQLRGL